jgi:hypothetical protein
LLTKIFVDYLWTQSLSKNYLDVIAIGVSHGLYVEELARDHLHIIVKTYIDDLFSTDTQKKFGLNKNDYTFLIAMDGGWRV